MKALFINAAFRDGSRTLRLAEHYIRRYENVERVELGDEEVPPFNRGILKKYNQAVAGHEFADPMFVLAKQFAEAEEIVIAAPFWNYGMPSILHSYLEYVCTQGISFDMDAEGRYVSLCHAKKIVYITTAGGPIPKEDHAFGYIRTISDAFFGAPQMEYYKADCLDVYGVNVEEKIREVQMQMDGQIK